ncbi:MAG: GNAT family N-acetyltransferase [Thermomicrobiales bacterium]
MSSIDIKQVAASDYGDKVRLVADYAFGSSPSVRDASKDEENLPFLKNVRAFVAFVDGAPQAAAGLFPMTQNVRGKVMKMSGVGGVATLPAARRQGLIRSLFSTLYESMHEYGEPVTTLYPFRESFYERLGYAPMSQSKFVRFASATLTPLAKIEVSGSAEQVFMHDGFDEWREYLKRYQGRTHGFAVNDLANALSDKKRNTKWIVFARDQSGTVVGAATFKITGYTGTLDANSFYYDSPEARLLLLQWFGRHVDQVNEIKISLAWDDLPEYWAADLYSKVVNHDEFFTTPMGRVVDVAALSGLKVGPGSIAIELVDSQCAWNTGTWTLAAGSDGMLEVGRGGEANAALTIQGLSALVFAGQDPADFRLRGWGDPDHDAQSSLRQMFPRAVVRLHEEF